MTQPDISTTQDTPDLVPVLSEDLAPTSASIQASEASQEASPSDEDEGGEDGEEEGEGAEGSDVGDAAAVASGEPGAKKRKRRRRKKKKPADGTTAEGAPSGMEDGSPAEFERTPFRAGEEVFGKVLQIGDDAIWVDIASKAIGLFDRRGVAEGDLPREGDQFIATVASVGYRGGMIMLARAGAPTLEETKLRLEAASKDGTLIEGFVTGLIKGGVEVDLDGLRAFAPASHMDLKGGSLSPLLGRRLEFAVTQFAKNGRDVVVSRKKLLELEQNIQRAASLSKIQVDGVYKAIVRKVVSWGVFVALPDADNVEGLIPLDETAHDRHAKLQDLFPPRAEIEVKVIKMDDRGKLWLSRKACVADPWGPVREKYTPGSRHKAKVVRVQAFGVFVELEPGIDALCHLADLSIKPIKAPTDVVKVDEEYDWIIAHCDAETKRISVHPAPPEGEERQRIQLHKAIKGVVVQTVEGGVVIRLTGVTGRNARAFLAGMQTGLPKGADLRKAFPIGKEIEAKVIDCDLRRGETKLSIRALHSDTEKQAFQAYRAEVKREAKFGTLGDLFGNIELKK